MILTVMAANVKSGDRMIAASNDNINWYNFGREDCYYIADWGIKCKGTKAYDSPQWKPTQSGYSLFKVEREPAHNEWGEICP